MRLYSDDIHKAFSHEIVGATHGVLLVHGYIGSPYEWWALADVLRERGISVHAVALPGFGQDIARLNTITADDWLGEARRAWREVRARYPRADLLGFSMGGAIAITLAAELSPERLVLFSPFTRLRGAWVRMLPVMRRVKPHVQVYHREDLERPDVQELYTFVDPSLTFDDPTTLDDLAAVSKVPVSSLIHLQRIGKLAMANAPRVTVPTLCLQGTSDTTVLPSETRELVARLGGPVDYREVECDHQIVRDERTCWPIVRDAVVQAIDGVPGAAPVG